MITTIPKSSITEDATLHQHRQKNHVAGEGRDRVQPYFKQWAVRHDQIHPGGVFNRRREASSPGGESLLYAAQTLVKAGWVTALNYGGGSSQGDFAGIKLDSTRIVYNFLCIWTKQKPTKYKICVVAGHGGTCANGSPDGSFREHAFALGLAWRCRISNAAKADFFVSIHTNAGGVVQSRSPVGAGHGHCRWPAPRRSGNQSRCVFHAAPDI